MRVEFRPAEPGHDPLACRGRAIHCFRCGERIKGLWENTYVPELEAGYRWLWGGRMLSNCQTEIVDGQSRWRHIECQGDSPQAF